MNFVIVPSPLQSALLQASIPPLAAPAPVVLTDLSDPAAMEAHQNHAVAYRLECKRRTEATTDDINNACRFEGGVATTQVLSQIPSVVNQVNIQNRINQMEVKLDGQEILMRTIDYSAMVGISKSYNASVTLASPILKPPPHLIVPAGQTLEQTITARVAAGQPAYPDPALHVPALPTNVLDIYVLSDQALVDIETYYDLPHVGSVEDRRQAIMAFYGVRVKQARKLNNA